MSNASPENNDVIISRLEDTITAMARRAYGEFVTQNTVFGQRFKTWDDTSFRVKANWKGIIRNALGETTSVANVNQMQRKSHTLVITGLDAEMLQAAQNGIVAKLEEYYKSAEKS